MSFKTKLTTDFKSVFLNRDEYAENIKYTPSGQSQRTIKAIVIRKRLSSSGEDTGRILQNQAEIYIANDSTYGVTSVDKGDDIVAMPEIEGGSDINWAIIDILEKDGGCWHLLIGK